MKKNIDRSNDITIEIINSEYGKTEIGVIEPAVRGFEWRLIREKGKGTYARIAGKYEDSDDEHIVIEEYDDTARRGISDELSNEAAVMIAHNEIVATLAENDDGNGRR